MAVDFKKIVTMDPSAFVVLADYVPAIIQEIRYYSTYNFIGDRIDGYEEPCAILTMEADWKRYRKRYRKTLSVFRHFPAKPFIFMPLFITEGVWL